MCFMLHSSLLISIFKKENRGDTVKSLVQGFGGANKIRTMSSVVRHGWHLKKKMTRMYFYLSLGSNISPEASAVRMVRALCLRFGKIGLFPFCYTPPEGINSDTLFLNGLAIIAASDAKLLVKDQLNAIETAMGRDRDDPERSYKDRTADIDILAQAEALDLRHFYAAPESYVQTCFHLRGTTRPDLRQWGLASYQRPSTVHVDTCTGKICVIEDELEGLKHWVETSFTGE